MADPKRKWGEMVYKGVYVDPKVWARFKDECRKHGLIHRPMISDVVNVALEKAAESLEKKFKKGGDEC